MNGMVLSMSNIAAAAVYVTGTFQQLLKAHVTILKHAHLRLKQIYCRFSFEKIYGYYINISNV